MNPEACLAAARREIDSAVERGDITDAEARTEWAHAQADYYAEKAQDDRDNY